jgi:hypothetical protein
MRTFAATIVLTLLTQSFFGTARAERMSVYDLDSLVYLATEVAEVEITRTYQQHDLALVDVKITDVHKGDFKKGQTVIVAGTDLYRKPEPKNDPNPQRLAVGDRLVIFAKRIEPSEFLKIPDDAVIYSPLTGGVRLVQKDNVFGFGQLDSRGPFVANVPAEPAKTNPMTLARLREQVRQSIKDTEAWARLVNAKQEKLDVPRLLKLLSARSGRTEGKDYFGERICMRFAASLDPELLSQALPLAKRYTEISILQRGFGSTKGRDYLLAKVTDAKAPMEDRLRFASALHEADPVYRSALIDITANSTRHVGKPDAGNSGYLTRIAKAAGASAKHDELCRRLVYCLDYFGQGIVQSRLEPVLEDMLAAFAVLKEVYDGKPSQELQYAIEKATAWDREAYEKLKSPCGTFISILRAADPARYTKPEKRSLIFEYEYTTVLLNRGAEARPSVVLVQERTQKKYVLPTQIQIRGWSTGGGSGSVELPKDLPAGKYRVFFQITDGDKVVSAGHYFVADL